MKKNGLILTCTGAILSSVCLAKSPSQVPSMEDSSQKPNIVFIYADDWGWGDLSCHGHSWLKTPNIDRLASQGIDFQQFNVNSPVCSPSRVSALTGYYPSRFGINGVFGGKNPDPEMPDWLDPKAPTTARSLKAAGYRTAHFGKWHMGDVPEISTYGFDESAVYHGNGPKIPLHEIGSYAAKFIEANKDRPFFVNVWLHESHTAHDPTPESLEKWKNLDEQKQIYAAVITDGDNEVGKVLDALEKAGVARNTIVVFSSDNGPESTGGPESKGLPGKFMTYYSIGETGGLRGRKRSLFEGGVRTPFIVRWPGHAPAGLKNNTTVLSAVDLLPTFCAAAVVPFTEVPKVDGENMLAAFNGKTVLRTKPIFWKWTGKDVEPDWWPRLAVRDGEWKLYMTADGKRVELHRLPVDRAESTDLAEKYPELVSRLSKMVLDWEITLPQKPNPDCINKSKPLIGDASGKKERTTKDSVINQTAEKKGADRNKAFNRWDVNKDGVLTLEEYKNGLSGQSDLEKRFAHFDKNGDGLVTHEEFIK